MNSATNFKRFSIKAKLSILTLLIVTACPKDKDPDNSIVDAKLIVEAALDFGKSETSKTFTIKNTGGETLSWTSTIDKSWLTITPEKGSLEGGKELTVTAKIDRTKLTTGNSIAKLVVTAHQDGKDLSGSPFEVRVKAVLEPVGKNRPFITKWKTTTSNESITIPTTGSGYNYSIDWGDGTTETGKTGNASHTYASTSTYTVQISGVFPRIYFNNDYPIDSGDNSTKIISLDQWGDIAWTSMEKAFRGCTNLAGQANDAPDLSKVTSMKNMFEGAGFFNQDISSWKVSKVTDMSEMFRVASAFNQNIGSWNVSKVTNMRLMFSNARSFNQNIGSWNVYNVTDMGMMFSGAGAFNQNIGSWNVAKVTDMGMMFSGASAFNQDIGSWNVSKVTDMSRMFSGASAFNQDIGSWNVAKVTDMSRMFYETSAFNQDISSWNVAEVTNMSRMFYETSAFNQNVSSWNVSKVTSMDAMFFGASAFNQDIGSWNVSKVTSMKWMFQGARSFNQNIGNWNVSKVTHMNSMFSRASLSTANYDTLLKGWASKSTQRNVTFDVGRSQYTSAGEAGRNTLISRGWTITDGGKKR